MTNKQKQFLLLGVFVVVALVLAKAFFSSVGLLGAVVAVFIALAIGVPIVWLLFKKEVKKIVKEAVTEAVKTPSPPKTDISKLLDKLLEISLQVRTGENVDADIISSVDAIVDGLAIVVPQMAEKYPSETITYELNRVCESHLLELLKEYLDLSSSVRIAHKEQVMESLKGISGIVNQARDIVERNNKSEFAVMAEFLKSKYN